MKYCSIDRLSDFEFHDSEWVLVELSSSRFIIDVKLLNLRKNAQQKYQWNRPFDI